MVSVWASAMKKAEVYMPVIEIFFLDTVIIIRSACGKYLIRWGCAGPGSGLSKFSL